jgi:ADP-heptose:LPS heptosyltransferase
MPVDRGLFRYRYHYVAAVASEAAAPLLRAWARYDAGPPAPPASWRRLVVLGSAHIGDILYRTPSLPQLRRALPDCEVSYVTSPLTAELLETNPVVDRVLPLAETRPEWRRDAAAILRAHRFDAVLCTDNIAYHRDLLLAVRARIPARIGYAHKGFSGFVTWAVPPTEHLPSPAYTRAMVANVCGLAPTWDLTPEIVTTPLDEQMADHVWRDLGLGAAPVTVACTLTTRQPDTATWPADSYMKALARLARTVDLEVVLCGSAADAPALEAAAATASFPCRVAAGRLTLRALAALLRRCRLLLATDSGVRHIANAVRTPVVFIRNLKVWQIETGVYCDNETDATPDGQLLDLPSQRAVLATVSPESVAALMRQRLEASARVR